MWSWLKRQWDDFRYPPLSNQQRRIATEGSEKRRREMRAFFERKMPLPEKSEDEKRKLAKLWWDTHRLDSFFDEIIAMEWLSNPANRKIVEDEAIAKREPMRRLEQYIKVTLAVIGRGLWGTGFGFIFASIAGNAIGGVAWLLGNTAMTDEISWKWRVASGIFFGLNAVERVIDPREAEFSYGRKTAAAVVSGANIGLLMFLFRWPGPPPSSEIGSFAVSAASFAAVCGCIPVVILELLCHAIKRRGFRVSNLVHAGAVLAAGKALRDWLSALLVRRKSPVDENLYGAARTAVPDETGAAASVTSEKPPVASHGK
jgi:hypothetical protein